MEHQLNMQQLLEQRDEEIARLQLEAEGAVNALRAAQAELTRQQNVPQAPRNVAPEPLSQADIVVKSLQTPTAIRDLPTFEGNPIRLNQFLKAVDNIMPTLEQARGTPQFNIWIQSIRSKIIGDADTVLELYGTDLSWREIKQNLITHYNDKRDEVSLTRDLFKLSQTGTYEAFYAEVSHIIALLLNNLNLSETNANVKTAKNKFYQEIGLKVFVAGLREPLGPIVRAQAPETLREALRLCAEENNYNYVRNPFKNHQTPAIPPRKNVPMLNKLPPPRLPHTNFSNPPYNPNPFKQPFQNNNQHQFKLPQFNPNPFKPQLNQNLFRSQPQNPFKIHYQNYPKPFQNNQNVFAPRPTIQPKPTPMEIDPSIRSRQINYMNRPHFHEQEYSENPYPHDPNDYYSYEPNPQEQYDNPTNPFSTIPTSQIPTDEENKETCDTTQIDDLNFQVASGTKEMT